MNAQKKICPLLLAGDPESTGASLGVQCKGDRCAWWAEDRCAVADIADSLCNLDRGGIIVNES